MILASWRFKLATAAWGSRRKLWRVIISMPLALASTSKSSKVCKTNKNWRVRNSCQSIVPLLLPFSVIRKVFTFFCWQQKCWKKATTTTFLITFDAVHSCKGAYCQNATEVNAKINEWQAFAASSINVKKLYIFLNKCTCSWATFHPLSLLFLKVALSKYLFHLRINYAFAFILKTPLETYFKTSITAPWTYYLCVPNKYVLQLHYSTSVMFTYLFRVKHLHNITNKVFRHSFVIDSLTHFVNGSKT